MATMHKLVSPEGVLHLLPVDDRSILEFTKVHGIKDKKYLMNQRELKCERPHNLMRSQSPETTCFTVSYSNFRDCI